MGKAIFPIEIEKLDGKNSFFPMDGAHNLLLTLQKEKFELIYFNLLQLIQSIL